MFGSILKTANWWSSEFPGQCHPMNSTANHRFTHDSPRCESHVFIWVKHFLLLLLGHFCQQRTVLLVLRFCRRWTIGVAPVSSFLCDIPLAGSMFGFFWILWMECKYLYIYIYIYITWYVYIYTYKLKEANQIHSERFLDISILHISNHTMRHLHHFNLMNFTGWTSPR